MKSIRERIASWPLIIWPLLAIALLSIPLTTTIITARADISERDLIKAELVRLNAVASEPALDTVFLDRLHRVTAELNGWQTSRASFGDSLRVAAAVRPAELNWERLVIQNQTTYGFKVPHLAYRPRARSTRIVLSGSAEGPASDLLIRTYHETLAETNNLGAIFPDIRNTGLVQLPSAQGERVHFNYTFEAVTPSRPMDRVSAP